MLSKYLRAFLATFLIVCWVSIWIWSSTHPPNQHNQTAAQHHQSNSAVNDNPSLFLAVGTWAESNHDAIEALSAIGVLIFTIALVAVTSFLFTATSRLATATAGLRDAEKEQAEELSKSTELAEKQFLITARQTDIAEKQHAIDFLRFHATNRPRLRIRHVWLTEAIEPDKPVVANVIYVNVGNTKAKVHNFGIDFNILWPGVKLPGNLTPPIRPGVPLPECGLGDTQSTGNVSTLAILDRNREKGIRDRTRTLCCFGFIEYSDIGPEQTRKIRRTAFCRMFVPTNNPIEGIGRFELPEKPDSDYEYED